MLIVSFDEFQTIELREVLRAYADSRLSRLGERWNAVLDIVPARGNRIFMDAMPGSILSGDDFVLNGAGLQAG